MEHIIEPFTFLSTCLLPQFTDLIFMPPVLMHNVCQSCKPLCQTIESNHYLIMTLSIKLLSSCKLFSCWLLVGLDSCFNDLPQGACVLTCWVEVFLWLRRLRLSCRWGRRVLTSVTELVICNSNKHQAYLDLLCCWPALSHEVESSSWVTSVRACQTTQPFIAASCSSRAAWCFKFLFRFCT